jgi:surface polysaccharide O-acyltransferase-like enzyme
MNPEINLHNGAARPSRLANMELLRCVAMMMVVVLHYLGKGGILADLSETGNTGYGMAAWVLECFAIVAVNSYMLLSGYFAKKAEFKLSRLVRLYVQVWLYSVVIGFLAYFIGIYPAEEFSVHYVLTLIFPITMGHYWFMSAYVLMYILIPLLGAGLRSMNRKQMQAAIILLLLFNCILKSVIPARLEMDAQGYDCLWYLCMFVIGLYISRFGAQITRASQGAALYIAGVALTFGELMLLHLVYVRTGSFGHIMKISIEYNHIFPLIASLGLFTMFININLKGKISDIILKLGPYTLGVYLLHENIAVRYEWQKWLGAERINSVTALLLWTAAAVITVFAAGIAIDFVRAKLTSGADKLLEHLKIYRALKEKIKSVDELFKVRRQEM